MYFPMANRLIHGNEFAPRFGLEFLSIKTNLELETTFVHAKPDKPNGYPNHFWVFFAPNPLIFSTKFQ
jgi:hypothetical protein